VDRFQCGEPAGTLTVATRSHLRVDSKVGGSEDLLYLRWPAAAMGAGPGRSRRRACRDSFASPSAGWRTPLGARSGKVRQGPAGGEAIEGAVSRTRRRRPAVIGGGP